MNNDELPNYSDVVDEYKVYRNNRQKRRRFLRLVILSVVIWLCYSYYNQSTRNVHDRNGAHLSAKRLEEDYATCSRLRHRPNDPSGHRERSARYVDGHRPYLIRNATIWTGDLVSDFPPEDAHDDESYSWVRGDVLMQHGLIKRVAEDIAQADLPKHCIVYDGAGRQLTAGLVDMHSHAGVDTLPDLRGSSDDNELSNDITPYVRSIDGLNPLDHQIQVIKSGGVTTSLILPGSGNNMGGEAFVIKHAVGRPDGRSEISAEDMLADPDHTWR